MTDLWQALPPLAQDAAILIALLIPVAVAGAVLLRGYAPLPLVGALLMRFRWANALFVALIAISVGMGVGLLAQERGLRQGTAQAADKFDLIVAAPGSELTMLFAAVYLQPSDVGLVSGAVYDEIAGHPRVDIAAPLAFGDSVGEAPVVGTTLDFLNHLTDGRVEGRGWQDTYEAVAGARVGLEIGDSFTPVHGVGDAADDAHGGHAYTVVGRMAPTGSPWDKAVLVTVESVWEVHGLANGHAPDRADQIGPPFDPAYFPGTPAVIVRANELWANYALRSEFTRDAETMAFFPGAVLANLYRVMGDVRQAMSLMALVTQALVAASVLTGLFILSRLFRRQLALLRALGAPARFVLAVIWSYATALLAGGAVLGGAVGVVAANILSGVVTARTDIVVTAAIGWQEVHLMAAFLTVTSLASLVPAAAILRQPTVEGLRT